MYEQKETLSGRGGWRGGGRPKKTEELKAKMHSFRLYDWEVEKVRQFIKSLRDNTSK